MNLNEQLQQAYEAGRRQALNEQNPIGGGGSRPDSGGGDDDTKRKFQLRAPQSAGMQGDQPNVPPLGVEEQQALDAMGIVWAMMYANPHFNWTDYGFNGTYFVADPVGCTSYCNYTLNITDWYCQVNWVDTGGDTGYWNLEFAGVGG